MSNLQADILACIKQGMTDDQIAEWSEAYTCSRAELIGVIRQLAKESTDE